MHLPSSLIVPHWRAIARHAVPKILEGKLVPAGLFIVVLEVAGANSAILAALAFALLAMAARVVRKQPITGLLWLTTIGLLARTIAALATGSVIVYFLQPTAATFLVGAAFLISVPLGKPLAERLALDLFPLDDDARDHPVLRRFFRHVSLWWAFTSMVNFAITLWLLLSQSATTFVVAKSMLGPITSSVTLIVAFFWFRTLMSRSGTSVVFGEPDVRFVPAATR